MDGVVIIGAGAAGLMAANDLAVQGYQVTILEAAERSGGRVHTITHPSFTRHIETGAEFIHGRLPVTLQLLDEANIRYEPVKGNMVRVNNCNWQTEDELITGWDELMQAMNGLEKDVTVAAFLQTHFGGEQHKQFRRTVQSFAEGYDLVDINKASLYALRNEWTNEEPEHYRIPGGYTQLIDYLENKALHNGCSIHHQCTAKKIETSAAGVTVTCSNQQVFRAGKTIVTIPLGVLQSKGETASLVITPEVPAYQKAIDGMGFGPVIKIQLQFTEMVWNNFASELGFILSDEIIRTWWTQFPGDYPLLTGWLGGASASAFKNKSDEEILQAALLSLSHVFCVPEQELGQFITGSLVHNWQNRALAMGGYSYDTLQSAASRRLLHQPIEGRIFFAGEALYEGAFPGTVEAALVSGQTVAQTIVTYG